MLNIFEVLICSIAPFNIDILFSLKVNFSLRLCKTNIALERYINYWLL